MRLQHSVIWGLLVIILSSFGVKNSIKEATVNQYNNFSQNWNYTQFIDNFVGGGGGSMTVNITDDLLTVSFSAGFSSNKLKNGYVVSFNTTPGLPDMELGFLSLNGSTINNDVKVSIVSNAIIFEHVAGNNNQVYSSVGSTFEVDLSITEAGGNNLVPYTSPQLSNENYVFTQSFQTETTTGNISYTKDVIEQITYFDGLGRPIQKIGIGQSPEAKDIVTHIDYDGIGRQDKVYLPYASSSTGVGAYRTDALSKTNTYYNTEKYEYTSNPYAQKLYDGSPLNLVIETAAPGNLWKEGIQEEHTVKNEYKLLEDTDVVNNFQVSYYSNGNPYLVSKGLFTIGDGGNQGATFKAPTLYKFITKNENWTVNQQFEHDNTVHVFKDYRGRIILNRTFNKDIKHDTYYVYNSYGNLSYVITPKVSVSTVTITELNELCYQYIYDAKNRIVKKKIPGKDWVYFIYDKLDRPVLIQEGMQRTDKKWMFTKYDKFDRAIYSGVYTHFSIISQASMQQYFDSQNNSQNNLFEEKVSFGIGYSSVNFPTSSIETLIINYYDNYDDFTTVKTITYDTDKTSTTRSKGLATGSKVKVLDTDEWITTITYYDDRARPIYVKSVNDYLNTIDIVESTLDFVGKVTKATRSHTKGSTNIITEDLFTYDHAGRLQKQTQEIKNTNVIEVIVENIFDELGALKSKKIGGGLQDIAYKYNIRGWLTDINDITNTDKLFNFHIGYTEGLTPLYNGNISQTKWRTNNDDFSLKAYDYTYDALDRITGGQDNTGKYNLGLVTYDKNGNITALKRQGAIVTDPILSNASHFGLMDNLDYDYQGNQLTKVAELSGGNKTYGFKDSSVNDQDYWYDANGNMTIDDNKGITGITYNHLNLPTYVTFSNGNIQYLYDATGVKLQKTVIESSKANIVTKYAGNYVYENNELQFFNHAEGYVSPEGTKWNYIYQYKDHLGNIRLSYTDADNSGTIEVTSDPLTTEIVEENNYYPFGLKHKGYNSNIVSEHQWKYNGKELEEALGLNMYDYGARQYDAAIGRFVVIDRYTEEFDFQSPYVYAANNPIIYIDKNGDGPILGIFGALAGALVEAGSQVVGAVATGSSWSEAVSKIDYADVGIAAVEYGIAGLTNGASLAIGAVVSDIAKASIDVTADGKIKTVFNRSKNIGNAVAEVVIGKVAGDLLGTVSKKVSGKVSELTEGLVNKVSKKLDKSFNSSSTSLESKTLAKDTKLDIQGAELITKNLTDKAMNAATSKQIEKIVIIKRNEL